MLTPKPLTNVNALQWCLTTMPLMINAFRVEDEDSKTDRKKDGPSSRNSKHTKKSSLNRCNEKFFSHSTKKLHIENMNDDMLGFISYNFWIVWMWGKRVKGFKTQITDSNSSSDWRQIFLYLRKQFQNYNVRYKNSPNTVNIKVVQ